MREAHAIEGPDTCWRYRIIAAPVNAIEDPWIHSLSQEGFDFQCIANILLSDRHDLGGSSIFCLTS